MLYTGKGDDGTTQTFDSHKRISKASARAEALGTVDELNSFLGVCKAFAADEMVSIGAVGPSVKEILHTVQKDLFIIQAEIGGAQKTIDRKKIDTLEGWIEEIEEELPQITSFFVPGGSKLAALLDTARATARRAERRVVGAQGHAEGELVGEDTVAYVNRLSSLLYACARLTNRKRGFKEDSPDYE